MIQPSSFYVFGFKLLSPHLFPISLIFSLFLYFLNYPVLIQYVDYSIFSAMSLLNILFLLF